MRSVQCGTRITAENEKLIRLKNISHAGIIDMPRDLGEKKLKLQEDLLKALKENYARDYKELIKKYFEALSQEMERQNETN